MKKITITVTLVLLGSLLAQSQDNVNQSQFDLDQIEEAYIISLGYDNIGIVESALYCVVKLQYKFPDKDFEGINKTVDDLSKNSETPLIRYKANVVKLYLNSPTLMKQLNEGNFEDGPDFWALLVNTIQSLPHNQILANSDSKKVSVLFR